MDRILFCLGVLFVITTEPFHRLVISALFATYYFTQCWRNRVQITVDAPNKIFKGTKYSAGFDIPPSENISVTNYGAFLVAKINTGIFVKIPTGFLGLLCPRSSAQKAVYIHGIIDSDYTGELIISAVLLNASAVDWTKPIAQLVLIPHHKLGGLPYKKSVRGSNGFGHTSQ